MDTRIRLGRRSALLGTAAAMGGWMLSARPGNLLSAACADDALKTIDIITTSGAPAIEQLMKDQNYLGQFGLNRNAVFVSDGNKALAALIGGGADIAVGTGFNDLLSAISKGAKVKILAGAFTVVNAAMYTSNPDIKSCKDLAGRTIGVGALGSLLHQAVTALLLAKGVDPSTVKFANVGSILDVFRAVTAGTVDAGPGPQDFYAQLDTYKLHALTDGKMWEELPEFTLQATYATDTVIREKRDLLVRTLAAYAKLYRFILEGDSFTPFSKARAEAYNKDDPKAAMDSWNFYREYKSFASGLILSEERVNYMQNLNMRVGGQKELMPYDQITDMSIARDAIKLLNG